MKHVSPHSLAVIGSCVFHAALIAAGVWGMKTPAVVVPPEEQVIEVSFVQLAAPVVKEPQQQQLSFMEQPPEQQQQPVLDEVPEIETQPEPEPESQPDIDPLPEPEPEPEPVEISESATADIPVKKPAYKKPKPKKKVVKKQPVKVKKQPQQKKAQRRQQIAKQTVQAPSSSNTTTSSAKPSRQPNASAQPQAQVQTTKPVAAAYLNNPAPPYPEKARLRKQQGTVLLNVRVSANGSPTSVSLARSSGHRLLDDAAIKTVRRWKFIPARRGNTPISASVEVPVVFVIRQRELFRISGP